MLASGGLVLQTLVCAALLRPPKPKKTNISYSNKSVEVSELGPKQCTANPNRLTKLRLAFKKSLDFSLWKSSHFIFYLAGRCLGLIAITPMVTYVIARTSYHGIDPLLGSFILTAYGIGSIIGRSLTSVITNARCTHRLGYYVASTWIGGILVCASVLISNQPYIFMLVYALYGITLGK